MSGKVYASTKQGGSENVTGGFSISDRASCVLCSVAGRDKRAAGKQ